MKKVVIILLVLLPLSLLAQKEHTISVNSHVYFKPQIKEYLVFMVLPLDMGGYRTGKRYADLEELKTEFLKVMKKKGVAASKFSENPIKILSSFRGNKNEQLSLLLRTTAKEDLISLMETDFYIQIYEANARLKLSPKEYAKLSEECLKKAKEAALILAQKSGKKLGAIQSISAEGLHAIDNAKIPIFDAIERQKFGLYVTFLTE